MCLKSWERTSFTEKSRLLVNLNLSWMRIEYHIDIVHWQYVDINVHVWSKGGRHLNVFIIRSHLAKNCALRFSLI